MFQIRAFQAVVFAVGLTFASIASAHAQLADMVLVNGKIITLDPVLPMAEAIAIRDGRIMAVGTSSMITAMSDGRTRVMNLNGRTVIPGLIDSHIHAIRAGLTFSGEVHWIGARSLEEALGRLRAAAKAAPKGSWLVVAGGWTEGQFAERRRPTQAEIAAAAPDHHVYVQNLYTAVLLSPGGVEALKIDANPGLASRLKVETDADGKQTGWLSGDNRTVSDVFNLLPRPDFSQQLAGTRAFFECSTASGSRAYSIPAATTCRLRSIVLYSSSGGIGS